MAESLHPALVSILRQQPMLSFGVLVGSRAYNTAHAASDWRELEDHQWEQQHAA